MDIITNLGAAVLSVEITDTLAGSWQNNFAMYCLALKLFVDPKYYDW